jgi:hypothetical protein
MMEVLFVLRRGFLEVALPLWEAIWASPNSPAVFLEDLELPIFNDQNDLSFAIVLPPSEHGPGAQASFPESDTVSALARAYFNWFAFAIARGNLEKFSVWR